MIKRLNKKSIVEEVKAPYDYGTLLRHLNALYSSEEEGFLIKMTNVLSDNLYKTGEAFEEYCALLKTIASVADLLRDGGIGIATGNYVFKYPSDRDPLTQSLILKMKDVLWDELKKSFAKFEAKLNEIKEGE